MNFVAIETATEWCSVALSQDGELSSLERRAGNRQGEFVLPMLDQLLEQAGLAMQDIDGIAFGSGPGAFTGLRIACGVAQGLALARGVPVIGVSTLEAVAEESGAARVIVAIDARMNEVYHASFERQAGAWKEVLPAVCAPPESVAIPEGNGWLACGSGFAVYRERFDPRLFAACERVAPEVRPSAVAIARLAAPRFAAGEGRDAAEAQPRYLRDKVALTSAEQARER